MRKLCAGLLALLAGIWGWIPGVWAASAAPAASPSGAVVPAAAGDSIESWLWITAITVALAVGYAAWRRYEKNKRRKKRLVCRLFFFFPGLYFAAIFGRIQGKI